MTTASEKWNNIIRSLTRRGTVLRVDDKTPIQTLQVQGTADEVRDRVERLQEYGLSSNPPEGSDVAWIHPLAAPDHPLVVACGDRKFRIKSMAPGEVVIYDDLGQFVRMRRDKIEVNGQRVLVDGAGATVDVNGGSVKVEAAAIELDGDVTVTGGLTVDGAAGIQASAGSVVAPAGQVQDLAGTLSVLRGAYNAHTHIGNMGSPTAPPIPTV